jgi:hypothetical protein
MRYDKVRGFSTAVYNLDKAMANGCSVLIIKYHIRPEARPVRCVI